MNTRLALLATSIVASASILLPAETHAAGASPGPSSSAPAVQKRKNWQAPPGRILAQKLVDEVMARHPELLSLTLHGVPPGTTVHTMFAGSFPERIGNADDPDDIGAQDHGLTILDPALGHDSKFVVFVPMRDASGQRIGTAVVAFKKVVGNARTPLEYYELALRVRKELQKGTPSFEALFRPSR